MHVKTHVEMLVETNFATTSTVMEATAHQRSRDRAQAGRRVRGRRQACVSGGLAGRLVGLRADRLAVRLVGWQAGLRGGFWRAGGRAGTAGRVLHAGMSHRHARERVLARGGGGYSPARAPAVDNSSLTDMCMDMCTHMCIGMCIGMCMDMCIDMYMDVCRNM